MLTHPNFQVFLVLNEMSGSTRHSRTILNRKAIITYQDALGGVRGRLEVEVGRRLRTRMVLAIRHGTPFAPFRVWLVKRRVAEPPCPLFMSTGDPDEAQSFILAGLIIQALQHRHGGRQKHGWRQARWPPPRRNHHKHTDSVSVFDTLRHDWFQMLLSCYFSAPYHWQFSTIVLVTRTL